MIFKNKSKYQKYKKIKSKIPHNYKIFKMKLFISMEFLKNTKVNKYFIKSKYHN